VTSSTLASATQIVGAVLVLSAYLLAQVGRLGPHAWTYLVLNSVGATMLALLAAEGQQWGFLLLEGVWAVASVVALTRRLFVMRTPPDARVVESPADKSNALHR
jgi:hypothetical protein